MSAAADPPQTYEKLTNRITARFPHMTKRARQIARFVTQNPNDVALNSINLIAERCGAHPSSLVRFAQQLGYTGFKDLQAVFQRRLATAAPGFSERIDALERELDLHHRDGVGSYLSDLVVRDIASLQELLENTAEADIAKAVDLLHRAETIYIAGQLRSEPVALFLRYVLTMLRRRVNLLDSAGGIATETAGLIGPKDALIAISFRYYAKEVVSIAEIAAERGAAVVAISDSQLSPLAKSAAVLFAIPEDDYSFSRSLAAPMCLAQALILALAGADRPAGSTPPRLPTVTQLDPSRSSVS